MKDLTIISVYYSPLSRDLLAYNYILTKRTNTHNNWEWIAVDNTSGEADLHLNPERFITIPGTPMQDMVAKLPEDFRPMKGSYHHAAALSKALEKVNTRFVLVLDYDFYIIAPEWISTVLAHMEKHSLAFFGPPWHPRWWKKVRYFPAQFALFIDTEKIDKASLDFTPAYDEEHPPAEASLRGITYPKLLMQLPFVSRLIKDLSHRSRIGSSRDTSYRIYEKYYRSGVGYESVKPVFKPRESSRRFVQKAKKVLTRPVPERFLYTPKDEQTYTTADFAARGYPDVLGTTGWEEYVWQERPFAFHLRGTSLWLGSTDAEKKDTVRNVINAFYPNTL